MVNPEENGGNQFVFFFFPVNVYQCVGSFRLDEGLPK